MDYSAPTIEAQLDVRAHLSFFGPKPPGRPGGGGPNHS
jgi:hypothetical protein